MLQLHGTLNKAIGRLLMEPRHRGCRRRGCSWGRHRLGRRHIKDSDSRECCMESLESPHCLGVSQAIIFVCLMAPKGVVLRGGRTLSSAHQWNGGSWPLSRQKTQNLHPPALERDPPSATPSSLDAIRPPALPGAMPLFGLGRPFTGSAPPSGLGPDSVAPPVKGTMCAACSPAAPASGAGTAPGPLKADAAVPVSGPGTGGTVGRPATTGAATTGLASSAAPGLTSAVPVLGT